MLDSVRHVMVVRHLRWAWREVDGVHGAKELSFSAFFKTKLANIADARSMNAIEARRPYNLSNTRGYLAPSQ